MESLLIKITFYTLGEPNPDSLSTMRVRIRLSQSVCFIYHHNVPFNVLKNVWTFRIPSGQLHNSHVCNSKMMLIEKTKRKLFIGFVIIKQNLRLVLSKTLFWLSSLMKTLFYVLFCNNILKIDLYNSNTLFILCL